MRGGVMFTNDLDPDLHPWLKEDIWSKRMRLTWKQAAKKWWKLCQEIPSVMEFRLQKKKADKRLELLRRVDDNSRVCPICFEITVDIEHEIDEVETKIIKGNHAANCELAKELGESNS
jgi:hypothetical protein